MKIAICILSFLLILSIWTDVHHMKQYSKSLENCSAAIDRYSKLLDELDSLSHRIGAIGDTISAHNDSIYEYFKLKEEKIK